MFLSTYTTVVTVLAIRFSLPCYRSSQIRRDSTLTLCSLWDLTSSLPVLIFQTLRSNKSKLPDEISIDSPLTSVSAVVEMNEYCITINYYFDGPSMFPYKSVLWCQYLLLSSILRTRWTIEGKERELSEPFSELCSSRTVLELVT